MDFIQDLNGRYTLILFTSLLKPNKTKTVVTDDIYSGVLEAIRLLIN